MFTWNGLELETYGDISDVISRIIADGTREDARSFMDAYRATNPHAATNIGYIAGYFSREQAERIWDWFECAHPFMGTRTDFTDEELFEMGRKLGESMKDE